MTRLSVVCCLALFLCLFSLPVLAQEPGTIIFSKSVINPASPGNLTTEFQAGDRIYAVAYFDKPVREMTRSENPKKIDAQIFLYELKPPLYSYQQPSENQMESNMIWVSGNALGNKHLLVDLVPSPQAMSAYGKPELIYEKFGSKFYGPVQYAEAISKLAGGEHTVIVKVQANYQFVAEGKFTIKGGDFAAYAAMSKELNDAAFGTFTKSVVMSKPGQSNKALEAEMIGAFKASNTYRDRIKGEVLRVVIIDPDWMIRRNELTGIILHRYIRAEFAVKNSDGTCTRWQLVTFQQDYVGNKFGKTRFDGVGDPVKIPCENVNK